MKIDWSAVLLNVWHLVLLGGSAYLAVSQPQLVPVLSPFIQAAGQFSPTPSVTMTKSDASAA
jgi:hypothetical protein